MNRQRKGFTLIEVMLVLAIAGLIFLMIFIALPALQRQSRDAQRREDFSQLASAIKKFQENNRGAIPSGLGDASRGSSSGTTWSGFYHDYLKEGFIDPSGGNYVFHVVECGETEVDKACKSGTNLRSATFPNDFKIYIVTGASCDGEIARASANPRRLAIEYKLEGGGVYCNGI